MSHHFDSPTAIQDGRVNLCDVFAFPGQPGRTVLILTVNPDAGRSSPDTFRPEAVYEFVIDASGRIGKACACACSLATRRLTGAKLCAS